MNAQARPEAAQPKPIEPTVGRIVWYYPSNALDPEMARLSGQPLAAVVTGVHKPDLVNLAVFDALGVCHARTRVRLRRDGEEIAYRDEPFCAWMPYQKGQAAKNDNDVATLKARLDALEGAFAQLAKDAKSSSNAQPDAPETPKPNEEQKAS